MDQLMWTAVICVTLTFLSGASSVKVLQGTWGGIIRLYDTETQENQVIVNGTRVTSLDYHFSKGQIYYAENDHVKRRSIDPNLKDVTVIAADEEVYGIAVDWQRDIIYWARSNDTVLVKADLDGNNQTSIITKGILNEVDGYNINYLYDIEVDPYEKSLFMIAGRTTGSFNGYLVKSDLEGRDLTVITDEKYRIITTFAIVRPSKILYVVKQSNEGIYSCKYNGEVVEKFSVCPGILWIYPFTVFRQNMYMSYSVDEDRRAETLHVEPLASVYCPSEQWKPDKLMKKGSIYDVKVYDVDIQPPINVSYMYQLSKQRFSNWDNCSLLSTQWDRFDCLEMASLKTTTTQNNEEGSSSPQPYSYNIKDESSSLSYNNEEGSSSPQPYSYNRRMESSSPSYNRRMESSSPSYNRRVVWSLYPYDRSVESSSPSYNRRVGWSSYPYNRRVESSSPSYNRRMESSSPSYNSEEGSYSPQPYSYNRRVESSSPSYYNEEGSSSPQPYSYNRRVESSSPLYNNEEGSSSPQPYSYNRRVESSSPSYNRRVGWSSYPYTIVRFSPSPPYSTEEESSSPPYIIIRSSSSPSYNSAGEYSSTSYNFEDLIKTARGSTDPSGTFADEM